MRRKRPGSVAIVPKHRQADRGLGKGGKVLKVCKTPKITQQACQRWRQKHGASQCVVMNANRYRPPRSKPIRCLLNQIGQRLRTVVSICGWWCVKIRGSHDRFLSAVSDSGGPCHAVQEPLRPEQNPMGALACHSRRRSAQRRQKRSHTHKIIGHSDCPFVLVRRLGYERHLKTAQFKFVGSLGLVAGTCSRWQHPPAGEASHEIHVCKSLLKESTAFQERLSVRTSNGSSSPALIEEMSAVKAYLYHAESTRRIVNENICSPD